MRTLLAELKIAVRSLARAPVFALVAVLTLGLGIGANTAIFGAVHSMLLRPLPYDDGERLVWIVNRYLPGGSTGAVSAPELWEYRRDQPALDGLAAMTTEAANLTGLDTPVRLQGLGVSPGFFELLGVSPALGRAFASEEEEPAREPVAILSHALWETAFGADPDVLERQVVLDGVAHSVVGIMPSDHRALGGLVFPGRPVDFWVPVVLDPATFDASTVERHSLSVVGKLARGATRPLAEAGLTAAVRRVEDLYPGMSGAGSRDVQVVPLGERVAGDVAPVLLLLMGSVAFVLLLACVNVANLLVARGDSRASEVAVRAALGASRPRLLLHALSESVAIGLAGGALGVGLAFGARAVFGAFAPDAYMIAGGFRFGLPVLAFTLAVSIATGLVAGAFPGFRTLRRDLVDELKASGGRGTTGAHRSLLKRGLAVSQVAGAVTLVAGAGLLARSLAELREVDPGFTPSGLVMAEVNAPRSGYGDIASVRALYETVESALLAVPGVETVTSSWQTPLQAGMSDWPLMADRGQDSEWISADPNLVSPAYFDTYGIGLMAGRHFDRSDLDRPEGAVVLSEAAARALWPDGQAVGRRVNVDFREPVWREVVGVVPDIKGRSLSADPRPQWYVTFSPGPFGSISGITLTARTSLPPEGLRSALVEVLAGIDGNIPVGRVASMDQQVSATLQTEALLSALLAAFGALALVLGSIGVYGVMAYSVQSRRRELGVRLVMGAERSSVLRLVVGQGLVLGAIGVAIGLVGALGVGRLLEGLLFGISSTDAPTLAGVSVLVLTVVVLATLAPAWRAASVDPMGTLRQE